MLEGKKKEDEVRYETKSKNNYFFLTFQAAESSISSKYIKYRKKCIESERNRDLEVCSLRSISKEKLNGR